MKKLLLSFLLLGGYQVQAADSHALQTDQVKQTMQTFQQQHVGIRLNQDKTVTLRFVQPEIIIIIPAPLVEQCGLLKDMSELFKDNYEEDIQKFTLTPEGVLLLIELYNKKLTIVDKKIQEPLLLDELVDLFMTVATLGYKHPDSEIDIIKILQENVKNLFLTAVHNNQIINPETLGKIQANALHNHLIEELSTRAGWRLLHTLIGNMNDVFSVAFNRDSSLVVTASKNREARIWDVKTGLCVRTFHGHTGPVYSAVFSPDGLSIATASHDRTAKIWDVATGVCTHTFKGHTSEVNSVAFNRDGSSIATASNDKTATLWKISTGLCVHTFEGHTGSVVSVAFSPDGSSIATTSEDNTAKLWDARTGKCIRTLEGHTGQVYSVAFSPDALSIATASHDETAKLWDARTGKCVKTLTGCRRSVAFSPDGQLLATDYSSNGIALRDSRTGNFVYASEGHRDSVTSVAFSHDGTLVATASKDNTAKLWGTSFAKAGLTAQQALTLSIEDALFVYNTGELPPKSVSKIQAAQPAKPVQEEDFFAPAGPADSVEPDTKKSNYFFEEEDIFDGEDADGSGEDNPDYSEDDDADGD